MIASYQKHSKRLTILLVALVVILGAVAFVSAAGTGQAPAARWISSINGGQTWTPLGK